METNYKIQRLEDIIEYGKKLNDTSIDFTGVTLVFRVTKITYKLLMAQIKEQMSFIGEAFDVDDLKMNRISFKIICNEEDTAKQIKEDIKESWHEGQLRKSEQNIVNKLKVFNGVQYLETCILDNSKEADEYMDAEKWNTTSDDEVISNDVSNGNTGIT